MILEMAKFVNLLVNTSLLHNGLFMTLNRKCYHAKEVRKYLISMRKFILKIPLMIPT
jgi:hypothetical protein